MSDVVISAFANYSLEPMDHFPDVLRGIARSLRPGASSLMSVVTHRFLEWAARPCLMDAVGEGHARRMP